MRKPPFTLEQLRTFQAVAQLGSMTLAGRSLGLTQGAITQQVQAMERELGLCLVRRTGRNVRLTPEGEAVAAAGRIAIRAIEGVMDVARSAASGETGHIRVGASPVTADYYVHRPLAALVEAHPHVSFDVTVGPAPQICEEVEMGLLDCGVVEGPLAPTPLPTVKLADDEVLLVAAPGHPVAGISPLTGEVLAGHRFLCGQEGSRLLEVARLMLGPALPALHRLQIGGIDALRAAALCGLGMAVLPRVAVQEELDTGRLVPLSLPPYRRGIHGLRSAQPSSAGADHLWRILAGPGEPGPAGA